MEFKEYLKHNRKQRHLLITYDIETFQYNESAGREQPTHYKNEIFSVAIGYFHNGQVYTKVYPDFKPFFEDVASVYNKTKNPSITLNAHNSNRYDNHYLLSDLLYYYDLPRHNMYLKSAKDNTYSTKKKDIAHGQKNGVIFEKRIKSYNNLELNFYIKHVEYITEDNYMKTNTSIKTLGYKLRQINVLTDAQLKTDFDYTKHNQPYDMTKDEAKAYARQVHNNLTDDELTYIKNDVIILHHAIIYYSQIFKGFDYSKITFSKNVLDIYNDNNLSRKQLTNAININGKKIHLKYTDYRFHNENLYDYLKPFYRGGMNLYNYRYLNQIIDEPVFSMDIKSSYPYAMHNFKIPTYVKSYRHYIKETDIDIIISDDEYFLYRITKKTFDRVILSRIHSRVIKQMLVKYYNTNDYININSYTIRILNEHLNLNITSLPVLSFISFECEYFGSRDKIEEFYFIKEQGKSDNALDYRSPYDIRVTDKPNVDDVFTSEEIDISKVNLNGVYGIPALRPFFNHWQVVNDTPVNHVNGYVNTERNIVFSIFVTSVAFWNLTRPFAYMSAQEIDDNFLYTDTDSLYFKRAVYENIPDSMLHHAHLGAWEIERDNIEKFIVINHKKYAFEFEGDIYVKSAGITESTFDTAMTFERFVDTQFTVGVKLPVTRSILNRQGVVSIYESTTELKAGKPYLLYSSSKLFNRIDTMIMNDIKRALSDPDYEDDAYDGLLYIETPFRTISVSDIFYEPFEYDDTLTIDYLMLTEDQFKQNI